MPRKRTVLVDFDGVLHQYSGWTGPEPVGEPIPNARHACHILAKEYNLVCFTTREPSYVVTWLARYGFPMMRVTSIKVPAHLQIDDRAIEFRGEWTDEFLRKVKEWRVYWEKGEEGPSSAPAPSSQPHP